MASKSQSSFLLSLDTEDKFSFPSAYLHKVNQTHTMSTESKLILHSTVRTTYCTIATLLLIDLWKFWLIFQTASFSAARGYQDSSFAH